MDDLSRFINIELKKVSSKKVIIIIKFQKGKTVEKIF